MSWAEEDWTVGLSGRVLQKVKELQVQQERLSREIKQKQLQLDNIHTSHEKQTKKYEEVRGELQSVQRELQSVREESKAAIASRERLSQELQTKQAQVCSLEGQLDSARTLNNKLTQEIKRLEAELEKLQNSCGSADTTLFSTPCWNTNSPWEQNGSRNEERLGQRDEGQSRGIHIRQRLQFSDNAKGSLPRQPCQSTPQSESFSTPVAAFPWERDDSRPAARRQSPSSPQTPLVNVISEGQPGQGFCGRVKDPTAETNKSLSEMQSQVSSLEEALSAKDNILKVTQSELMQSKKELAAKELNLQKAHARITQEGERASGIEQRLKQVQEELKCQRQNAESSRLQHQQRIKDLEKQHQRDLMEFQKERQSLEKQHQQEMNKLNQELQQARTLHNALQAQADKLSLQKQALDKDLDSLKEKLKWTEGQLQESLKKETLTQARLTEAVREAEGVAVGLEQSRKREQVLEEEGKRLAEERADALRLLRELQEEKAAPPLQPVQICPVGQSFSPKSSYSLHSRPSAHTKRPTAATQAEWKREEVENIDERRVEISAPYPTDREPGEGIDSEHITDVISPDSEHSQEEGHRSKSNEEENKSRNEETECYRSGTNKHSFDHVITTTHRSDGSNNNATMDDNLCSLRLSAEKGPLPGSEQTKNFEDLKRENASLRLELHDVREELQKRLEDLETQRRAETEARTRLKQLSRKHATQCVEKDEKDKERRVQLESERAETEKLRKAIAALQTEIKRSKAEREKEREEQEEGKTKAQEDRESEIMELNIQLKKQLAEVKAQLALEREERKLEEERNQVTQKDIDLKKQFIMEMAELKAQYEQVKCSKKEDLLEEDNLSVTSPLTYLTLHDDDLNSNIVQCDNNYLPLPEQHILFCQSANQRNMLVSQAATDLIQEEQTVTDPECSPLSGEGQAGQMTSASKDTKQSYMGMSSLSDHRRQLSNFQEDDLATSGLEKEVQHLQNESAKETERANQYQVKLEALQSQVTRQTHQLTMAFERQSQHISGLLSELQEKESALLSQGEELQHYKQELNALKGQKDQKEPEEMMVKKVEDGETQDERLGLSEISGLRPAQKECADTFADSETNVVREGGEPKELTSDADMPTPINSEEAIEQHPGFVKLDKTQSNHDTACAIVTETEGSRDGRRGDVVAELLSLRQENWLLKQRIEALTISDIKKSALQSESENQEVTFEQSNNTGNAAQSCLMEHRVPSDEATGEQPIERRVEDEESKDKQTTWTEGECIKMSQLHIDHLEHKVEALQLKVRALSEQTQQQAEELTVWRLASQPAPTFNQIHHSTETVTQGQISAVTESQSATDDINQAQMQMLDPAESLCNVTVIREDELFLSCSSNNLQGRMLFSRLQHNNLPEPMSLQPSKKTSGLQYNVDITDRVDKEAEKENHENNFFQQSDTCSIQCKEKANIKLIQMSSEKIGQQQVTKDVREVSGSTIREPSEGHTGPPEDKPDISRQTNEINTASSSSNKDFSIKMKSASSQTEDSLISDKDPVSLELHCVSTQTEKDVVDLLSVSPVPSSEIAGSGDKVLFSGSFPIPADPARLAERIRRNRTQLSAAFDDTEYEPYGLPEVVMKGFADIPTGPSCPYIVRRGLLGTTVVPVPQKDPGQEETD